MTSTAQHPHRRHRLTVEEYHRMGEAGILAPDARVELIEGEIIDMAPIGSRHAGIVEQLSYLFEQALRGRAMIRAQNPVSLGARSEPQPDVALVRPRSDFYKSAHPRPSDILLLVEVADASLDHDRDVKTPLYAAHGIPEAWLIDLESSLLTRYREPSPAGYGYAELLEAARSVAVSAFSDVSIDLSALFAD